MLVRVVDCDGKFHVQDLVAVHDNVRLVVLTNTTRRGENRATIDEQAVAARFDRKVEFARVVREVGLEALPSDVDQDRGRIRVGWWYVSVHELAVVGWRDACGQIRIRQATFYRMQNRIREY